MHCCYVIFSESRNAEKNIGPAVTLFCTKRPEKPHKLKVLNKRYVSRLKPIYLSPNSRNPFSYMKFYGKCPYAWLGFGVHSKLSYLSIKSSPLNSYGKEFHCVFLHIASSSSIHFVSLQSNLIFFFCLSV